LSGPEEPPRSPRFASSLFVLSALLSINPHNFLPLPSTLARPRPDSPSTPLSFAAPVSRICSTLLARTLPFKIFAPPVGSRSSFHWEAFLCFAFRCPSLFCDSPVRSSPLCPGSGARGEETGGWERANSGRTLCFRLVSAPIPPFLLFVWERGGGVAVSSFLSLHPQEDEGMRKQSQQQRESQEMGDRRARNRTRPAVIHPSAEGQHRNKSPPCPTTDSPTAWVPYTPIAGGIRYLYRYPTPFPPPTPSNRIVTHLLRWASPPLSSTRGYKIQYLSRHCFLLIFTAMG